MQQVVGGRARREVRGLFDLAIKSACSRNSKKELWTVLYGHQLSGVAAFSESGCIRGTNLEPLAPPMHNVCEMWFQGLDNCTRCELWRHKSSEII